MYSLYLETYKLPHFSMLINFNFKLQWLKRIRKLQDIINQRTEVRPFPKQATVLKCIFDLAIKDMAKSFSKYKKEKKGKNLDKLRSKLNKHMLVRNRGQSNTIQLFI